MQRLTGRDVRARRLARHGLTAPLDDPTPAGAARAMHAVHAQVMPAAEVSVAIRVPGATRETVAAALADGSLTKVFGPRSTVHLVPTTDLPAWVGALGAVPPGRSPFAADVRLSDEQRDDVLAAIGEALLLGDLTVDELDREVVARAGSWAGELVMPAFQGFWPRWRQAVADAGARGLLVFGAPRGRLVTYTHPRRRDPAFAPWPAERALPWFRDGYLRAFGPASPEHLARWLVAPVAWCTDLFTGAEEVAVDDGTAWVCAGDTAPEGLGRSVRLLPYFDALTVGFVPRSAMFPGRAWERALARGQAGNFPVVLVDGVVRGVWHQRSRGRYVEVTVETWGSFGALRRRQLDAQVERLGAVLGRTPRLTRGPVSVGPHA